MKYKQSKNLAWSSIGSIKGHFSNICYPLTSKKKKKMWGKNLPFLL